MVSSPFRTYPLCRTRRDLDKLPKHLESRRVPDANPNAQVRIPFLSLTKLKAMCSWFLAQRCIGVDGGNKLATEDTDICKPEKLTDLAKWTKFWEVLTTYLGRVKGAALTPLSYLIWEHEEVTQDHHDADYQSVQERLIATTALNGTHFDLDNNHTLYNVFKLLVVDEPGWSFIKKFNRSKDG